MDAKEFAELTADLKLSSEQIEMTRRVLVDGESRATVAAGARGAGQVSKVLYSRLQTALDKVLGRKLEKEGVPPNWRVITVVVPRSAAERVREIARQARAERIDRVITDTSLKGAREVPVRRRKKKTQTAGSPLGGRVGGIRITLGSEGIETASVKSGKAKTKAKKAAAPKARAKTPKKSAPKKRSSATPKVSRTARTKKKKSARR